MRQLIAGNWKMHTLRAEAATLATAVRDGSVGLGCDLLICPPSVHLESIARLVAGSSVTVGGQNCHQDKQGAHTGDVSAPMLRDVGATWVILGHSERRQDHGETDEIVREKAVAATAAGLTPIICVGETDEHRRDGQETEVVGWQIAGSLPKGFEGVVAYEPIWAIGSGKTPTEQQVATMHAFIREELSRQFGEAGGRIRILYGGSVRPANCGSLLTLPEVNGALVGGASLKAEDFLAIAHGARAG
jgi:triosephosphate isomerase